eukprot:Skav229006  [mRNA]  locus=scaffold127:369569:369999:+ [translate_table: standard]
MATMKARAVELLVLLGFCANMVFVPSPRHVAPVAAGALGTLAAAPTYADKIDDAAKALEKTFAHMGAAVDTDALKQGVEAHANAIAATDCKLAATLDHCAAIKSILPLDA